MNETKKSGSISTKTEPEKPNDFILDGYLKSKSCVLPSRTETARD